MTRLTEDARAKVLDLEFGEIYVRQDRSIVLGQIAKAGVRLLEQAMKQYP